MCQTLHFLTEFSKTEVEGEGEGLGCDLRPPLHPTSLLSPHPLSLRTQESLICGIFEFAPQTKRRLGPCSQDGRVHLPAPCVPALSEPQFPPPRSRMTTHCPGKNSKFWPCQGIDGSVNGQIRFESNLTESNKALAGQIHCQLCPSEPWLVNTSAHIEMLYTWNSSTEQALPLLCACALVSSS